jgi:K+-transporting ATPase KdpF subunit
MDLLFVGLIVVLAVLTGGGIVLCARLQPLGLLGYLLYAMLNAEKF